MHIKGRLDKSDLFFSKFKIAQTETTNPNATEDISQPSRIIKVTKLNKPKRNISLPGNLTNNSR